MGTNVNSGSSKVWPEQSSNDMFHPCMRLKQLRALRKRTTYPCWRKMWSLQIRNFYRREVRVCTTGQLQMFFGTASRWKGLRKFLPRPIGCFCMRGGGFVCWCHSTFGEAEVSDLNLEPL